MPALTAVLVGLGHRTAVYAHFAKVNPDQLQVVGLADPDEQRLAQFAAKWEIPEERCFASGEELAEVPKFADIAINGTMDQAHVSTTVPLVEAGYHVLLEKPISPDAIGLSQIEAAVAANPPARVVVCHVLRYAPFYSQIKQRISDGEIGAIMHIHTTENVSYHHMAVAFVRGKWNRREVNPMLLAKCCHDLDLLCWFKDETYPTTVASFGGRHYFTPPNAPKGAGTHCQKCEIERSCEYSARRHHIENGWWPFYAWAGEPSYESGEELDDETQEKWLAESEYSRCVWHCDNDVVDRQSVMIQFSDGCVATHDMVSNAARATRKIHIIGTKGEISGDLELGSFSVLTPAATSGEEWSEEVVEIEVKGDMHGGGDDLLMADFLSIVQGQTPSLSTSELEVSINGHLLAYAADISMQEQKVVRLDDLAE